jgi:hypothetical protein
MRWDMAHEVHAAAPLGGSTFATAALMPSWAPEITSPTPRKLAQEAGPEHPGLGARPR